MTRERTAARIEMGDAFGRLVVVDEAPRDRHGFRMLVVLCNCGTTKTVRAGNLAQHLISSCGCLRREWMTKLGRSCVGSKAKQRKGQLTC